VFAKIAEGVRTSIDNRVEAHYSGIELDMRKEGNSLANPQGTPFPTPVCNLAASTKEEKEHTKESHPSTISHSHGTISCGEFTEFVNKANPVDVTPPKGLREGAYQNGARNASLICYSEKVLSEIESGNKLTVTRDECEELAKAVDALSKKKEEFLNSSHVAKLGEDGGFCELEGKDKQDITECKDLVNTIEHGDLTVQTVKNRYVSCILKSAREKLEAAFGELALCEITGRAKKAFQSYFTERSAGTGKTKIEVPIEAMATYCHQQANKAAKSKIKIGFIKLRYSDSTKYFRKFNECYKKEFLNIFEQTVPTLFLSTGACSDTGPVFTYAPTTPCTEAGGTDDDDYSGVCVFPINPESETASCPKGSPSGHTATTPAELNYETYDKTPPMGMSCDSVLHDYTCSSGYHEFSSKAQEVETCGETCSGDPAGVTVRAKIYEIGCRL